MFHNTIAMLQYAKIIGMSDILHLLGTSKHPLTQHLSHSTVSEQVPVFDRSPAFCSSNTWPTWPTWQGRHGNLQNLLVGMVLAWFLKRAFTSVLIWNTPLNIQSFTPFFIVLVGLCKCSHCILSSLVKFDSQQERQCTKTQDDAPNLA